MSATFYGADGWREKGKSGVGVTIAFMLENEGDDERAVTPRMTLEVVDSNTGEKGVVGTDLSEPPCTGRVPPHGKFQCVGLYTFTGSEIPKALKVRVDGAWFDIVPDQPDAGTK